MPLKFKNTVLVLDCLIFSSPPPSIKQFRSCMQGRVLALERESDMNLFRKGVSHNTRTILWYANIVWHLFLVEEVLNQHIYISSIWLHLSTWPTLSQISITALGTVRKYGNISFDRSLSLVFTVWKLQSVSSNRSKHFTPFWLTLFRSA